MHFERFLIDLFWSDKKSFRRTYGDFGTHQAGVKVSRQFMKI